ncbi:MAG: UDP-glucose--hexose-1-phosphate uridylyltransferase [Pseudomonadales bacterium]
MAERRFDPLGDRWVIVSPQRVQRPWRGERAPEPGAAPPRRADDCYLCPGATRAGGQVNPDYAGVLVFDNDFPGLGAGDPSAADHRQPQSRPAGLLERRPVTGRCRVLCYHPRHDLTLATLPAGALEAVIGCWIDEHTTLSRDHDWVQIFENKGRMMGCSSDHPHGQIWASDHVPTLPAIEDRTQAAHLASHGTPLLLDYARQELELGDRLVVANGSWLAVVPWWAAWPFETLLLPRRPLASFDAVTPRAQADLSELLGRLLAAYDALFDVPMPYSMGWHGRGRRQAGHWQLHAHVYPPLLRSASVRKFMVGYEMLAEAQRDLTPEQAAARLRDQLVD